MSIELILKKNAEANNQRESQSREETNVAPGITMVSHRSLVKSTNSFIK